MTASSSTRFPLTFFLLRLFSDVGMILAYAFVKGAKLLYLPHEDGQGLVEYALILLLIAIAVLVIVALFGDELVLAYSRVVSAWPS